MNSIFCDFSFLDLGEERPSEKSFTTVTFSVQRNRCAHSLNGGVEYFLRLFIFAGAPPNFRWNGMSPAFKAIALTLLPFRSTPPLGTKQIIYI